MGNYQESSREAYNMVKPTLCNTRAIVLQIIKRLGPCSDKQIAATLNWPINRVTPRRNELEASGLIQPLPQKQKNENGISVLMWTESNNAKEAA